MSRAKQSIRAVLAENVKKLREKQGWTQEQLGQKSDTSQRTISNIEKQANDPSSEVIDAVAGAFGLPGWFLLVPGMTDDLRASPELVHMVERYVDFAKTRT